MPAQAPQRRYAPTLGLARAGTARLASDTSRYRHRARQSAIDRDVLAVYVGRLVARQEKRHVRDLLRHAIALEWIELADLVRCAALLGIVEDWLGHAGLDDARTNRVHPYPSAAQIVGRCRGQIDHASFARAVRSAAGTRADRKSTRLNSSHTVIS